MFPINIQDTVFHFSVCLKYVIDPRPADVGLKQPEEFKPLNTVMCHYTHFIIKIPQFSVIFPSYPSSASGFCNRPASQFGLILQFTKVSNKMCFIHLFFERDTEPQASHQKKK